jgi:peptidoglycan hydrolase-like protein with peptidoglycan-binding domain
MHGGVWRAGSVAIAISIFTPPTGAVATDRMVQLAQSLSDASRGPSPVVDAPAVLPANTPEQIRKAQTELRRLDCLKGRIDGKLGDQTRQAVKSFLTMAKQPAVEVNITDELISNLAERGDGFCRPVRPFFGFGGHRGGNSALPVPFAPRPRGPSPEAAH